MRETCEQCGVEYGIGQWYRCPHEFTGLAAIGDDIPGGQVIENLGDEPMTFYSRHAIREEADRRGLRLRDQWAGPGDRYLSNWAAVSPKTLEDARVLLERVGKAADQPRATLETLQLTVRNV